MNNRKDGIGYLQSWSNTVDIKLYILPTYTTFKGYKLKRQDSFRRIIHYETKKSNKFDQKHIN